jgi:hypothetical protein
MARLEKHQTEATHMTLLIQDGSEKIRKVHRLANFADDAIENAAKLNNW